jgi:hypothetical protein
MTRPLDASEGPVQRDSLIIGGLDPFTGLNPSTDLGRPAEQLDAAERRGGWRGARPFADLAERRRAIEGHVQLLWTGLEGIACLAFGHGPYYDDHESYRHDRLEQRFYAWPADKIRLVDDAVEATMAANIDVYITPALRTRRSRKAGTAARSLYLWSDVDGEWTFERQRTLAGLWSPGSFVVDSGRGRHVYLKLARAMPASWIEERNYRLSMMLGGEKWEENALLRLVGTWWLKDAVHGGPFRVVNWSQR